jgi:hypothetical protein
MSEQRYPKYWPGTLPAVTLEIHHEPSVLPSAVGVVFRHEQQPQIGLDAEADVPRARSRAVGSSSQLSRALSKVRLELDIAESMVAGRYKVGGAWLETYGGHVYRYEGEELGATAEVGFEVVEEPDVKPALRIDFSEE